MLMMTMRNIILFSTVKNLQFLSACKALLMDGTFYCCPALFYQLFIVHGQQNYTYVPLAYFLLPSKTSECYEQALKKNEITITLNVMPVSVTVDLEDAIHTAVTKVWSSVNIKGCRFHLGQSWYRRIQKLGLTQTYRSASAEGSYLRTFFGLSFFHLMKLKTFPQRLDSARDPSGRAG